MIRFRHADICRDVDSELFTLRRQILLHAHWHAKALLQGLSRRFGRALACGCNHLLGIFTLYWSKRAALLCAATQSAQQKNAGYNARDCFSNHIRFPHFPFPVIQRVSWNQRYRKNRIKSASNRKRTVICSARSVPVRHDGDDLPTCALDRQQRNLRHGKNRKQDQYPKNEIKQVPF